MKKHYSLGILFLLLAIFSTKAQVESRSKVAHCYFDELLEQQIKNDPAVQIRLDAMDMAVDQYLTAKEKGNGGEIIKSLNDKIIIPVVVNVVHQNGPENITDLQVISQLNALNAYYENYGIQFCLATKKGSINLTSINTPAGITSTTPGIFHYYSPSLTNHDVSQQVALKNTLSTLPAENYLKIWVVNNITSAGLPPGSIIQGYSSLPESTSTYMDGVVMDYNAFGDIATCGCSTLASYSQLGRVLVHETGHYLGLFHTFQGGCAGMNATTCATEGDRVCDTPPVTVNGNTGCPAPGWNTCNETPNLPDDIHNYMDYIDESCMTGFTTGQNNRMHAMITLYRANLGSSTNLVYTGVNCNNELMAHFTASTYATCTGTPITFTANPVVGATYTWDFGDGSSATGPVVTHTFTSAFAPVEVTLIMSNATEEIAKSELLFISNCSPINNTESTWLFGYQAGLNFNSGVPVYDNSADVNNTMLGNHEAIVSQCNAAGNLLFYSNGVTIWDKNHLMISNGIGGDESSATGSMAIPNPANTNQYYLFNTSLSNGLVYSIINISGTQASVVSNSNNVPTPAGYIQQNGTLWSGEGITAIPSCNNDYWIIVHGKKAEYDNYIMVYKLSTAGLVFHSEQSLNSFNGYFSTIEASPNGKKVLVSEFVGNNMYLCDFNPVNGSFTGVTILPRERMYGTSFSPDSKLFYGIMETTGEVFQYELAAPNVFLSELKVGTLINTFSVKRLGMQMGPDHKIYISRNMQQMAVIHAPNERSTLSQPNLCFFDNNGPFLDALPASAGLPNMIDAKQIEFSSDTIYSTEERCDTYTFSSNICASSYSWNFGDPSSGSANSASIASPTHVFSGPGTYLVTVTGNGVTLSQTIIVPPGCLPCVCPTSASFSYSIDEERCVVKFNSNQLINSCLTNVTYSWDFGDGTIGTGSDLEHSFSHAGIYTVCLTIAASNGTELCTVTSCKRIETKCTPPCDCKLKPSFTYDFDEKECLYTFNGIHGGPTCLENVEYTWDFGDGTTSMGQTTGHVFPEAGSFEVCLTVTVRNEKGEEICSERYCETVKSPCRGKCDCKLTPTFELTYLESCKFLFTGFSGSPCMNITSMEWFVNDVGPLSSQTMIHQFEVNTAYNICFVVKGDNGDEKCEEKVCAEYFYTDCYPHQGNKTTDFTADNALPKLMVYPNPANESFNVKLLMETDASTQVTLKSADGKLIGSYTFIKGNQEMEIHIPATLSNGFLFVEVQSGDYLFTEKLLIIH